MKMNGTEPLTSSIRNISWPPTSPVGPNPSSARPWVRPCSVPDAHASFSRDIFSTPCYVTSTCHVVYSQAGERVSELEPLPLWRSCKSDWPHFSSLHTLTLSNPTNIFPHKTLPYCTFHCRSLGLKQGLKTMPERLMTKLHRTLTYSNVSVFQGYVTFFSFFFKASFPWGLECARTCSTGETASTLGNPISMCCTEPQFQICSAVMGNDNEYNLSLSSALRLFLKNKLFIYNKRVSSTNNLLCSVEHKKRSLDKCLEFSPIFHMQWQWTSCKKALEYSIWFHIISLPKPYPSFIWETDQNCIQS